MKTILVVDDDKLILRLATEALRGYAEGFRVKTALNGKEAVGALSQTRIDLVLTDLKMPLMDGYELLSYISKNHRDIPVIVMTGFGSPEIARRLKQKGVLHYIEKPFEINMLREKIAGVFDARSKGYIHGFTLANFLQAVEVEQKTITLKIRSNRRVGYLHLDKGNLIDAEAENVKGEKAAIEILCWDDAEIEIKDPRKTKKTINASLMHILLEASKQKDERGDAGEATHDTLDEAIRLAEGHHFKDAQRLITSILKSNPRNFRAWLWYSRIIVSMKHIETSLNNAAKLAPIDLEIVEETKKFIMAKKRIKSERVRHCPFCWSPVNMRAVFCQYCKAHFLIHDQFFSTVGSANVSIMEKAIERYTKVIGREKNINAHYYLSVAHLNLEHWEESLNLFHKTVKLAPKKEFFSNQLRKLLNYMALSSSKYGFEKELKPQEAEPLPEDVSKSEEKRKKILVVEDSSTTRKVISITLGQNGYDIIEARDGLEALSRLNEERPDLILLDIILPKMDGYKILSIIKSNALFKTIPVIMLTSRDSIMSKVKGRLAGSTAYLTKPFEPKKLVETIQKYV